MLATFLLCSTSLAEPLTVRVPRPESDKDPRNDYYLQLLDLALEKTRDEFGDFRVVPAKLRMTVQERGIQYLRSGDVIDVIWTMTSNERERKVRPVRVPLLKGLLGYRVLLIRGDEQPRFDKVQSLGDLQVLAAGQGAGWPDVNILEANGLHVETSPAYERLFTMLQHKRFDFFPRGITEAWMELELRPNAGLKVEDNLLLVYKAPIYFFVHPSNEALATRLHRGLMLTMQDGSFDALFKSHHLPNIKDRHLRNRRRIEISNPYLPMATPAEDDMWFQPTTSPTAP